MPYPQPPQQPAGNQKYQRHDGQQPIPRRAPAKKILQRPVLDQGQRHQEGQNYQHRLAVDAEGVLAVLPGAVQEDVQRLHVLQGEKADGGVDKEQARFKEAVAAAGANFKNAMEMYKDLFAELDDSDPTSLSGAIKGASQESIDLLAGQTNAVRQNQVVSIEIFRQQLTRLTSMDNRLGNIAASLLSILSRLGIDDEEDLRSQGITD